MRAFDPENPPLTSEEAALLRYGVTTFSDGRPYDPFQCAYHLVKDKRVGVQLQCGYRPTTGPGNLYCSKHAKVVAKVLSNNRRS